MVGVRKTKERDHEWRPDWWCQQKLGRQACSSSVYAVKFFVLRRYRFGSPAEYMDKSSGYLF